MIVLLVVSGVQLTILGVLGEYLWRTLDQKRRRPIFAIATIVEGKAADSKVEAERQDGG